MRMRISRKTAQWVFWISAIIASLVGLYSLGDYLTPRGADGRPLIFSPSVRRAEAYRRAALAWMDEMVEISTGLTDLLAQDEIVDSAQLYALSEDAQQLVEQSIGVVQDVAFTSAPPALVGLREQVGGVAEVYFEAAQAAALWVGTPEDQAFKTARSNLQMAQTLHERLSNSRWLAKETNNE